MKKLFTLVCLVFAMFSVSAQTVHNPIARKAAENFWQRTQSNHASADLAFALNLQADTSLFVYNIGNQGFVIVSGDYSAEPVLAWSDEGNFKPNDLAPSTLAWLQIYADQIAWAKNNKSSVSKNMNWSELLSTPAVQLPAKSIKTVAPLLTTKWDQGKYYNYHCPAYPSGPDGHCVTGCVATAMAQIMKYYNYPDQGVGSHYYSHPHFGFIGADFGTTTYDWTAMGNSGNLTNQDAIGTLMFHCGVSVDMDYSPTASGAQSENAVTSFKNYFHYRNTVKSESKHYYSEPDWVVMLKDNMDMHHPVLYSGSGSGGGHAFVCDGYDASNRFHINWGWGGSSNGYFLTNNLNPSGMTFNSYQAAIINITPYFAPYCMESRTFTDSTKIISDGSGYSYYWNDTDCDFLIKPTGAESVMLEFTEFKTEEGVDIVSVYDGETTSAPLLGTFSGYDTPPMLTAGSGKMLITFSSSSATQELGWTAKYWCLKQGTGVEENEGISLSVYPNPATHDLTLSLPGFTHNAANITITDAMGKLVYQQDQSAIRNNSLKIDVSSLDAGFYVVSLQSEKQLARVKFIKQ